MLQHLIVSTLTDMVSICLISCNGKYEGRFFFFFFLSFKLFKRSYSLTYEWIEVWHYTYCDAF